MTSRRSRTPSDNRNVRRDRAQHQLANRGIAVNAEGMADVPLRIGVDEQNARAAPGHPSGQVDGGRRLADTAFHVHNRDPHRARRHHQPRAARVA
jgi:hypothetical protein